MSHVIAVDTGGTFTDLAAFDMEDGGVTYAKSPTTHGDLCDGVMACVAKAGTPLGETRLVKHGTTLVINALLQRAGARTALLGNKGFRDILEIGRGNRAVPFDLAYRRTPPLVPRELRFEISGRMDAKGGEIAPLDLAGLEALAETLEGEAVEAVAISFINSYAAPEQERAAAQALRRLLPGVYVSAGSELSGEWYEFERTSTAAANAFVGPTMGAYLTGLEERLGSGGFQASLALMGSNGGLLSAERAAARPVALVESGPVGGCIGAASLAGALGLEHAIAFDMGGTTAKCALLDHGRFDVTPVTYVGGYARGFPVRAASVDIVEVGAGGGSIAWLDEQGRLNVGPRSAGSEPGPAAYGQGGDEPTVTDANLVLGRLAAQAFLGGEMPLDAGAAERALSRRIARPLGLAGEAGTRRAADGILAIANLAMAGALKQISLERGHDPRDFALIAYGGAGPLHASAIAREIGIPEVVIPPEPGNFAAIGMLLADARIDEGRTLYRPLDGDALGEMAAWFTDAEVRAAETLARETDAPDCAFEHHAELRYRGQVHSVRTRLDGVDGVGALREHFEARYRARYGHAQTSIPVEIVGQHLVAAAQTPRPAFERLRRISPGGDARAGSRPVLFSGADGPLETDVYQRENLAGGFSAAGPAVIEEYGSTTLVAPDERFEIGRLGEIRIRRAGGRHGD